MKNVLGAPRPHHAWTFSPLSEHSVALDRGYFDVCAGWQAERPAQHCETRLKLCLTARWPPKAPRAG